MQVPVTPVERLQSPCCFHSALVNLEHVSLLETHIESLSWHTP